MGPRRGAAPVPGIPAGTAFVPKKRWGQNFLASEHVAEEMVSAMGIVPSETVLEIGPGTGVLTRHLLRTGAAVVCVEIDPALCGMLREGMGDAHPSLRVINGDILGCRLAGLCDGRLRVVTNAPYYISSGLLAMFCEQGESIADIHIMLQLEVGATLLASPGAKSYSRATVAMSLAHEIRRIMDVPRHLFSPEPRVDSVVLGMRPTRRLDQETRRRLDRLLGAAFRHRRKKLRNALGGTPFGETMARLGISLDLRADQVPPEDYLRVVRETPAG